MYVRQLNVCGNILEQKHIGSILKPVHLVSCQNWTVKQSVNQITNIAETPPTEDGPGRNGLFVDPEWNLREDDGHDAGDVGLDQEEAHLPLQMEVNGHDDVFSCRQQTGTCLNLELEINTTYILMLNSLLSSQLVRFISHQMSLQSSAALPGTSMFDNLTFLMQQQQCSFYLFLPKWSIFW